MKSFILLVLILITGYEVQSKRKQCNKWVKLTCNNRTSGKCHMLEVDDHKSRPPQQILKVIMKHDGNIRKELNSSSSLNQVTFGVEKGCPKPYIQTAYRTAKTTVRCDHMDMSMVWFFCKQNESCEDLITTASSQKSDETFTRTKTGSGFSLSISDVSSHHAGLYWCGVKEGDKYQVSLTQLKIKESITNFTKSPAVGENFTYYCKYHKDYNSTKFICKGEDPSTCQHLVSTTKPDMSAKFNMNDDTENKKITITVREVTAADSGTYWCGVESTDEQRCNTFIHRMILNVDREVQGKGKQPNNRVEFICNPKTRGRCQILEEAGFKSANSQNNFKVIIKHDDKMKTSKCTEGFNTYSGLYEVKIDVACKTDKTTIKCSHNDKFKVWCFCRDKGNFTTDDFITRSTSSLKSDETFPLTKTGSGFSLSISNVSSRHAGLYWCGVKEDKIYYVSLTQQRVKDNLTIRSPRAVDAADDDGGDSDGDSKEGDGGDSNRDDDNDDDDDDDDEQQTTSVSPVHSTKTATASTEKQQTTSVSPVHSTKTATASTEITSLPTSATPSVNLFITPAERTIGGSGIASLLIVGAVLLMLLLVMASILSKKRFSISKNRAAEQHPQEVPVYEEIENNILKPEPVKALTTTYVTLQMPQCTAGSLHDSPINVQSSSTDVEAVIPVPKDVNQPSRLTNEPFYLMAWES
ncbi:uncharacterized protein LOC121636945 [Melanotaenia boesemani]|uniref:uncharacterized protein LOC121636945 n=1 Tax=Melanotaenia boesemani TaxID=1250792 RepID=UPI001C03B235|nr:uncharacterized protein LOC121636945 [Melanotaenia boesemani]